ncbi:CidA/LrgA family protein [Peribacillus sp. SCS-155]|uniref:CidA/LrgA family protein n=1 Tax=Peribacillus sedimenti TaxID=3115297 RepID=UPI0039069292
MKTVKIIFQIAFLVILFQIGTRITDVWNLPIPGSMVGLAILFVLLTFNLVKLEWIESGASWLLAELMLFFIPAAVGVVNYQQALGSQWAKLLIVIVLSSLTVMAFTGLTAQYIATRGKGFFSGSRHRHR